MRGARRLQAVLKTLFILVIFVIYGITSAPLCPAEQLILPCRCLEKPNEIQIWCSYGDISKLADGLKAVGRYVSKEIDELIVENNLLPTFPGEIFSPVKVLRLMLRDNGIQRIASNWLSGLENTLQEIYIVEPELRSFPDESLVTVPKLEALTLSAGSITKIPAIFGLARLRYIQIEAPLMTNIVKNNFEGLPFLEQLHVTSAPRFHRLESEFLHDLPKLSILNFTQCGLNYIHPRALTRLPSLTELSFAGNKFKDARAVGMAIRDFPNLASVRLEKNLIDKLEEASFVDIPSLRNLYLSDNKITNIYRAAFHRIPFLRSVDLSNNQIRIIHPESFLPAGESNVEELRLTNNRIEYSMIIRLLLDALPRLRLLDLSRNLLQDIPFGTIQNHLHLEILHLEHNRLQRIDKEAFTILPSLRELKLANNSLSNFLRTPFWNLPALKGLDLSANKFDHLDRYIISGIPSLRRLDISHNNIKTVEQLAFMVTPQLEHVNLSHNAIDILTPPTLTHLQKLYDLDLSYNNFSQVISGLPKNIEYLYLSHNQITIIPSFNSNDLQLPSLKLLDLSGNKIHFIPEGSFNMMCTLRDLYLNENSLQKLDHTSMNGLSQLRTLHLAQNKLIMISQDTFKQMKHLTELNLRGNRLEIFDPTLLSQNTELKKLDMGQNRIADSMQAAFATNMKIEELNLSHNSITEFPSPLSTMPSLQMLDLSFNQMKTLPLNMLPSMRALKELHLSKNKIQVLAEGVFDKLSNLTVLDLENNDLERITSHALKSLPNLITVKLAKNKLSSIPSSTFTNLPQLQSVELQENQLTNVANDAFTACPNLLMLNLSNNFLTDMSRSGFGSVKTLEALDLSYNRIARFVVDSMKDMNFLVLLKMDNNRLCNIEGAPFERMSRLRMLSLRDNKMTNLDENTFKKLRTSTMFLDIEGNPIKCSCNMLWLQSWLQQNELNYPGPVCSDGIFLRDRKISKTHCEDTTNEIVPGCDFKPTKGTVGSLFNFPTPSVVVPNSTLKPVQTNFSSKGNSSKPLLPLPEETDYFDPKFVEYRENSTKLDTVKPSIPPEILSHYISGDTPTLYAGVRSRNTTSKENVPPSQSNNTGAAFTFFGVPIPSLNLNNFWNSGKSTEKLRQDGGRDSRMPTHPEIHKDGFIPMLPGVGGFTPIINSSEVGNIHKQSNNRIPGHGTVSKVAFSVPNNDPLDVDKILGEITSDLYNDNHTIDSRDSLFESSTTVSSVSNSPKPQVAINTSKVQHQESYHAPSFGTASSSTVGPFYNQVKKPAAHPYSNSYTTPEHTSPLMDKMSIAEGSDNTDYSLSSSFSPSPLSGFLVPGGQIPSSPSLPGRPTITKVQLVPGPSPHTEDVQSSHLRLVKSSVQSSTVANFAITSSTSNTILSSSTGKTTYENDSFNWYFSNYNRSNIEPYVGKTSVQFSTCHQNKHSLPLYFLSVFLSLAYL